MHTQSLERSRTGSTARRSTQKNSRNGGSTSPGGVPLDGRRISVMSNQYAQREVAPFGPTFRAPGLEYDEQLQVHGESQIMLGGLITENSYVGADRSLGSGVLSSTRFHNVSFPDQVPATVTLNPHRVNTSGFDSEPF